MIFEVPCLVVKTGFKISTWHSAGQFSSLEWHPACIYLRVAKPVYGEILSATMITTFGALSSQGWAPAFISPCCATPVMRSASVAEPVDQLISYGSNLPVPNWFGSNQKGPALAP